MSMKPIRTVHQPMKRKLTALLGLLPGLSACDGFVLAIGGYGRGDPEEGWTKDYQKDSPFLFGQSTVLETKGVPVHTSRLKQRAGTKTASLDELNNLPSPIIKNAITLGYLQPVEKRMLVDTRVFVVSIQPDVVLLVPHDFRMEEGVNGRPPYWSTGSIDIQQNEWNARFGLQHYTLGLEHAGLTNRAELSTIFPDVDGIKVLSDQWEGARSLAQIQAEGLVPFNVEPVPGKPGLLHMVLKGPGKAGQ
jgi:hypothetical protein